MSLSTKQKAALTALLLAIVAAFATFGITTHSPRPTPTPTPTVSVSDSPTPTVTSTSTPTSGPDWVATVRAAAGVLPNVPRTTVTGDYVARADGQTVSNLTVTGTLYVIGNNVTVANVKAHDIAINQAPGGNYAVIVKDGMTFRHVEAVGVASIGGTHVTITDSKFGAGQTGTAIQLSNYTQPDGTYMPDDYLDFERNVVDGLAHINAGIGVHSEAIHLMGVRHSVIRDNVFNWTAPDAGTWAQVSAVIFLQGWDKVPITDAVVDHNDISGGSYFATYMGGVANVLTNNTFHRTDSRTAAVYPLNPGETLTRSGNTLDGADIG